MFCWVFLNCLNITYVVEPLLTYYLQGVAVTCCLGFILAVLEMITGDNRIYLWWETEQRRQVGEL